MERLTELDSATAGGTLDAATASGTLDAAANTIGPAEMASIDAKIAAQQATAAGVPTAAEVAAAEQQFLGAPAADRAFDYSTTPLSDSTLLERGAGLDNFGNPLGMTQAEIDALTASSAQQTAVASGAQQAALDTTRGSASGFLGNLKEAGQDILAGEFRGSLTNLSEAFLPNFQVNNAIKEAAKAGSPHAGMAWEDIPQVAKQSYLRAAANAGVSTTQKLMGYAPLALGAASAGGFFETEPQEPVGILDRDLQGNLITGADLIDADPEKYQIFPYGNYRRNYMPDYSQTLVASTNPGMAPAYGETGGQVFPRRNGGIMMDEGIPNEDSVRAMLMPGEFVMTTDAVRGAGNGNVDQGIKNMYTVMRGLERRGGAMS